MSDFKERLLKEKDELTEKIVKLDAFVSSDKINAVDQIQVSLLRVQLCAMRTYEKCLEERIDDL